MSDDLPKNVLRTVKMKTGKNVSEKDIFKLASGVKPSTFQNEKQLRQLIMQVAGLVQAPVSEATIDEIVSTVKKSGIHPNNLEALMKMLTDKS